MEFDYVQKLATDTLRFIGCIDKNYEISITKNIDKFFESDSKTCKIDLINNKKRVESVIDYSQKNITSSIEKLKHFSKYKTNDFYDTFPLAEKSSYKKINDKELMLLTNEDIISLSKDLLKMNKDIYKLIGVKSVESHLEYDNSSEHLIAKDFLYSEDYVSLEFMTQVSCINKSESTHSAHKEIYRLKDLDIEKHKQELIDKIKIEKNPKDAKNLDIKSYDLIFGNECFAQLLEMYVIDMISIEDFIQKDNYLSSGSNLNPDLRIFEDPHVDYASNSTNYDYDFILAKKQFILDNGIIKTKFCTLDKAYKYGAKPTGNSRSDIVSNIFVSHGLKSYQNLLSQTKKGIIINDIMGAHTTNSNTGSLNVVASGLLVENGQVTGALKNIALDENILDITKDIELSRETKWIGNYNIPTLFCKR